MATYGAELPLMAQTPVGDGHCNTYAASNSTMLDVAVPAASIGLVDSGEDKALCEESVVLNLP